MTIDVHKNKVKLDWELSPHVVCYAALMQALQSRSEELLREAARLIREMYVKGLISPLEVGYILCVTIPANTLEGYISQIIDDQEKNKRMLDEKIIRLVAKEAFGGIPIRGERAALFFAARPPLDWMLKQVTIGTFRSGLTDISDFLRMVVEDTGVTPELLHQILLNVEKPWPPVDTPMSRYITGASCGLDRYVLEPHTLGSVREKHPDEFVDAVYAYFEPALKKVVETGQLGENGSYYLVRHYNVSQVVRTLLDSLVPLVETGKLSEDRRGKVVELCLLLPVLKHHAIVDRLSMVQDVFNAGWISYADSEKLTAACEKLTEKLFGEFCGTDFSYAGKHGKLPVLLRDMARTMAALVMLSPIGTGRATAGLYAGFKRQYFSQVKADTARKRVGDVLERMVAEFPKTIELVSRYWVGMDKKLDRVISNLFTKTISRIA